MTTDALIMFSGALIALTPFLGFPVSWDKVIFFLLGILVISLGIAVRRGRVKQARLPRQQSISFTESSPGSGASHEIRH